MRNITALLTFTGPISATARQQAEQLANQQGTSKKSEQVYRNALAVSFVNSYLQCMGFETDLEASDSWNPVQQIFLDVADLLLKNLGKLECRPVLPNTNFVYVPPEVDANRIGYVAVQIGESFREATLLGFVKQAVTDAIPISQLQPLEDLLEHLEYLIQINQIESSPSTTPGKTLVNLKQWFKNVFEDGWQDLETLFGTELLDPAWHYRNMSVRRGKLIDLGIQLTSQSAVLVVVLTAENEQEISIIVEVCPISSQKYLPPHLYLIVSDGEGATVMEAQARSENKNIQLHFSGKPGERFSVKLVLGDVSVIEDFVI